MEGIVMAKGREVHEARMERVRSFGKELARAAKSRCELCEASGGRLEICELPPEPAEPDPERCLLLCERCRLEAAQPARFQPGEHWRCLAGAAWSERPVVQALAVRLLRRQAASQTWAREALEELFLDAEVESLAAAGK